MNGPLFTRRLETQCTIEIEHSEKSLHAHVELDEQDDLRPGDSVRVHGEAISVTFGQKLKLRRPATVMRAGFFERQWTRLAARFDLAELCDVSFTSGKLS